MKTATTPSPIAILTALATLALAFPATAATIYWDGSTSSVWGTDTNWSDTANGLGNPGVPDAGDTAQFSASSVATPPTVSLDGNVAVSGLYFGNHTNVGTTLLQSDSTTARTITVGTGGLSNYGRPVTVGNATNPVHIVLGGATVAGGIGANQTWTNSNSAYNPLFTILSDITGTATTGNTQTLALSAGSQGANSGFSLEGIIADGTGGGRLGLTKDGANLLYLKGASTYTGPTSITGGLVRTQNNQALGINSAVTISGNSTLQVNVGTLTIGSLAGAAGTAVQIGGGLYVGGDNTSTEFAGNVTGDNKLYKVGTGTLTLSGDNDWSNGSGFTVVNGGILRAGSAASFDFDANGMVANATTAGGTATIDLNGYNHIVNNYIDFGGTTGGTAGAGAINTISTGAGTLTLNFNLRYNADNNPGTATLSGNLALARPSGTPEFSIADSTATGTELTISANISGTGSQGITKSGAGTLVLSGTNTYTGLTTVSAGTLIVTNSQALGTTANGTKLNPSATLSLQGVSIGAEALELAGGKLRNLSGNNTYGGPITLTSGSAIESDAGLLTLSSGSAIANTGSFDLTFRGDGDIRVVDNLGTVDNTRLLTKEGSGTVTLEGASTFTGDTRVYGGVLRLNDANSIKGGLGATGGQCLLTIGDGGGAGGVVGLGATDFGRTPGTGASQFRFTTGAGGFAAYGADRSVNIGGAGAAYFWNTVFGNNTLILGADDADARIIVQNPLNLNGTTRSIQVVDNPGSSADRAVINGILSNSSGTAGLIKTGNGILELAANNSYNGPTQVTAGTLLVNGNQSAATGAVTVSANATIGGTGTVGGATTIQTLGRLSPGNSPGVLTFANGLTMQDGTVYLFEAINGTLGSGYDSVAVSGGSLTLGEVVLDLHNGAGVKRTEPQDFVLFSFVGRAPNIDGLTVNLHDFWYGLPTVGIVGSQVVLGGVGFIPEPSAVALLALACFAARRRRRR